MTNAVKIDAAKADTANAAHEKADHVKIDQAKAVMAKEDSAKADAAKVSLKELLLGEIPSLRSFAMSLCGNLDHADDLVQETIMKAWANACSFTKGTNLRAWLFTIMRNTFVSQYRKARREVQDVDGEAASQMVSYPDQLSHLDFTDFKAELDRLPTDQREALVLVGAYGFSYEESAQICGCAIGTIKSRVNRARQSLMQNLSIKSAEDYGPDLRVSAMGASASEAT